MAIKVADAVVPIECKVPPWFADMVDDAARKEGISRYKWMQRTVAAALGVDYPLKRTGPDKAPWED